LLTSTSRASGCAKIAVTKVTGKNQVLIRNRFSGGTGTRPLEPV